MVTDNGECTASGFACFVKKHSVQCTGCREVCLFFLLENEQSHTERLVEGADGLVVGHSVFGNVGIRKTRDIDERESTV